MEQLLQEGDVIVNPDGSVTIPTDKGDITVKPDGEIEVPNEGTHDTVIKPGADATVQPDGSVTYQMKMEQIQRLNQMEL